MQGISSHYGRKNAKRMMSFVGSEERQTTPLISNVLIVVYYFILGIIFE